MKPRCIKSLRRFYERLQHSFIPITIKSNQRPHPLTSNAALSGSQQDGANDFWKWFYQGTFGGDFGAGDGWNKGSDINVRIAANPVPEPATMLLLGAGLLGLVGLRKRLMK